MVHQFIYRKNNFLVLGVDIIIVFLYSKDKISIKVTKTDIIFYLILHCNDGGSYLDVYKTEICKFKMHINIPWYKFCLGSISEYF